MAPAFRPDIVLSAPADLAGWQPDLTDVYELAQAGYVFARVEHKTRWMIVEMRVEPARSYCHTWVYENSSPPIPIDDQILIESAIKKVLLS